MDSSKIRNFPKNPGSPKEGLNKISFIYYYEIIYTKKLLGYLQLRFISDFHSRSVDFSKIVNFLKNLGLLKTGLNKIGFIHYYNIIHTKKLLGHLWLWFVYTTLILELLIF